MTFRIDRMCEKIFLIICCFFMIERIYMPTTVTSGTYNNYLSIILAIFSFGLLLVKNRGAVLDRKSTLIFIVFTLFLLGQAFLLQANSLELVRYESDAILIFLGYQIHFRYVDILFKFEFLMGAIYGILLPNYYDNRITGFLTTSPTNFSLLILIGLAYFLFKENIEIIDWLFILLGYYLIYLTYSRSILLVGLILFAYRLLNYELKKYKQFKFVVFTLVTLVSIIAVYKVLPYLLTIRSDGGDSTRTRTYLIVSLFGNLRENIKYIFFGFGGGASYQFIQNLLGTKLPPHFDILVLLYDLGIVGSGLFFLIIKDCLGEKWKICLIILITGAFHNLLFFPYGLLMIFILFGSPKFNVRTVKLE